MSATEVRAPFTDPIRGQRCELVIPHGGRVFARDGAPKIGVDHPACDSRADLAVEVDCFYCPACGWNGRISGAWAVELVEAAEGRGA